MKTIRQIRIWPSEFSQHRRRVRDPGQTIQNALPRLPNCTTNISLAQLRHRVSNTPLKKILVSETLSTISSSIAVTATPLIAITSLDASIMEIGVLTAAALAAPLIFGLSAGAIADRLNMGRALLSCGVLRLLLMAMLPFTFHFHVATVPLLCAVSFGLSAVKLVFDSVIAAAIPSIVRREDLPKANGWMEGANSAAYAIGPAIAGWLTQVASPATVYLVSCALYLASTLILRSVSLPQVERTACVSRSHLSDIAEGVRVLWQSEVQRNIAVSAALFNLFHSAFFTVFAIFLLKNLSLNASTFGTLMSSVAFVGLLGAVFGPKVVAKLGARSTLVGSLLLIGPLGIPIILTETMSSPYRVLVIGTCLAMWDFMIVVHIIVEQTLRQTMVSRHHLARVTATTRFLSWGVDPIGALAGGLLAASSVGTKGTLLICLLGFVASGVLLMISKSIRELRYRELMAGVSTTE